MESEQGMKHYFYFPTKAEAEWFKDGSEVLSGAADFVKIEHSQVRDEYFALYESEGHINPSDARVIRDEAELYGCTQVVSNQG